ncbi:hypothetical protein CHS0354_000863 [Potamilus streckersoni]|uniref:RING-type E3 ubiquitin transferase n=1 Tax=Potamilus streckersoni TaxID=2493646 RepID=A0AAE0S316_9BIVA|nr:hypothetical protein CHS0354_000863 [Potamilus streckersoni]
MGNKFNCVSDRGGDKTDKKNCVILTGEIKDREDLKKRLSGYDNSNRLHNVVHPYEENSALLIFENKVDVRTLQKWIEPFEIKRLKAKEVDYLVPDHLVKSAHTTGQMKTLLTDLKETFGVEVSKQDDKIYLVGVSTQQIVVAKNYLVQFLKKGSNMKQNSMIMNSSMHDEESYSQIVKLNNVSEVEFRALEILEHGSERIKYTRLSWKDDAIVIDGPASFTRIVQTELNSQLETLRNKQSEEISLEKEERKVVEDIMGEVQSEDMICIYDKRKSQVVVYSDKQENIMKFKHKLKLKSGKLKESVRNKKRFMENRFLSEAAQGEINPSSTEIRQEFSCIKDASGIEIFYTKENIKVYVYIADILNLPVDCIVNAGNYNLQHGGGIAKVIADAAGPELVHEGNSIIRRKGKIAIGCQVTTTAGRLPYTCVIHTVGPCWSDYEPHNYEKVKDCEEDLYSAIYGCFIEAEKIGLSKIALPAVSSGIYAVPREMCAVQYAKAVVDYSYSRQFKQGQSLKEIHFIDKVPSLVKLMQDTFRTMIQNGNVPDYNIHNYVGCSSSYQRQQPKETGRQGRGKQEFAVNYNLHETTEPNKLSPVFYEPTIDGKAPNCNIQNSVAFSSNYQQQKSKQTGRKGREKQDSTVNNSQYEISKPNKSSCVDYDPVVNGKAPDCNIQFSSSYQQQKSKETGRKGREKQDSTLNNSQYEISKPNKSSCVDYDPVVYGKAPDCNIQFSSSYQQQQSKEMGWKGRGNSQYETTNLKKLSPVYYEPVKNHKRHFVFHVSVKPVVCIYEGDILKLKHIDAIVCPVDSEGLGMGRIAKELMDKTKYRQNKDMCFRRQKPNHGDVVITDGEENPFNVIVHVVIENNSPQGQEIKSKVQESIDNILRKTNDCINVKTIALPLFGVKQEFLTDKSWAELFLDRFINFCYEVENPNLEEVHIITDISSSSAYSTVKKVFVDYTDERNNAHSHPKMAPPRPPFSEVYTTCDVIQDPMSGQGHKSKNDEGTDDNCTICLCTKTDPKFLPCGHSFCSECYSQMLEQRPVCAICGTIVGTITGNQPNDGRMYVRTSLMSLAGYEEHGCIEITYDFPAGRQGPDHPSPGVWYGHMTRTAYLPNTPEGRNVCRMLQLAFERRLVFTISQSRTTGKEGLTWNDIHHKTNPNPGTQFGYPDPEYLSRVKDELAAKGITEADLRKEETNV